MKNTFLASGQPVQPDEAGDISHGSDAGQDDEGGVGPRFHGHQVMMSETGDAQKNSDENGGGEEKQSSDRDARQGSRQDEGI